MTFIQSEGKFNENSYLIDGLYTGTPGTLALYVIEHEGERLLVDTGTPDVFPKVYRKLLHLGLDPIHKILLTHSHADHVAATHRFRKFFKDVEVFASARAIKNLKHPERMNAVLGEECKPVLKVNPLVEGDIIDLNGLELKVYDFFGHTQDSIAIFDEKNKNIFVGDTILDKYDPNSYNPTFFPPDFKEDALLSTFNKLRVLRHKLSSISLAHYGVWTGEDFHHIVDQMQPIHEQARDALIEWHASGLPLEEVTAKYREVFIPDSNFFKAGNLYGLKMIIEWLLIGLKMAGMIKD